MTVEEMSENVSVKTMEAQVVRAEILSTFRKGLSYKGRVLPE